MSTLRPLCASCGNLLTVSLFHAKADLRFCEACLSVTRVQAPVPHQQAATSLEMTGAAVLRLASTLEYDSRLQATLAVDPDQHWLLQLPPLRHAALEPYCDASAVRLSRDAQLTLTRQPGGRNRL